jgi:hypothetical protein
MDRALGHVLSGAHLIVVSFDDIYVGGNGAEVLVRFLVAYVAGAEDLLYLAGD